MAEAIASAKRCHLHLIRRVPKHPASARPAHGGRWPL